MNKQPRVGSLCAWYNPYDNARNTYSVGIKAYGGYGDFRLVESSKITDATNIYAGSWLPVNESTHLLINRPRQ